MEYAHTHEIALFVHPEMYLPGRVSRSRRKHVYKEIWDGHDEEAQELSAEFFCYPMEYDHDFKIDRNEIWQMNKNGKNKLLKLEYSYVMSDETSILLSNFQLFNQSHRNIPNNRNERRKQVQQFYDFAKGRLYNYLKRIPINFDEDGIEEMRLDFEYVLEKYSFLKEIIDPILPMIFGPPDFELQK